MTTAETSQRWLERLGALNLPAPAKRLARCRALLGQRHSSLRDVSELIRRDAALSLRVLRQVNRLRHARGRKPDVLSVEMAANLLGEQALRQCIEGCPELEKKLPEGDCRQAYLEQLDHALQVAWVAEQVAQARGDRSAGELYMIAMLRETPELALCMESTETAQKIQRLMANGRLCLHAAAEQVLSLSWPELTRGLLLERWLLPAQILPNDGHLPDIGVRDTGPLIVAETVRQARLGGWYSDNYQHCETVLGEHIWAGRPQAHRVLQSAVLGCAHSEEWLVDARLAQRMLDPPGWQPVSPERADDREGAQQPVATTVKPSLPNPATPRPPITPKTLNEGQAAQVKAKAKARVQAEALALAAKSLRAQIDADAPDVSSILRALLQGLTEGLGLRSAGIFILDPESGLLQARAVSGDDPKRLRAQKLEAGAQWLTGAVLAKPAFFHVDQTKAERCAPRIPKGLRTLGWSSDFIIGSLYAGEKPLALVVAQGAVLRHERRAAQARSLHGLANKALSHFAATKRHAHTPQPSITPIQRAAGE